MSLRITQRGGVRPRSALIAAIIGMLMTLWVATGRAEPGPAIGVGVVLIALVIWLGRPGDRVLLTLNEDELVDEATHDRVAWTEVEHAEHRGREVHLRVRGEAFAIPLSGVEPDRETILHEIRMRLAAVGIELHEPGSPA